MAKSNKTRKSMTDGGLFSRTTEPPVQQGVTQSSPPPPEISAPVVDEPVPMAKEMAKQETPDKKPSTKASAKKTSTKLSKKKLASEFWSIVDGIELEEEGYIRQTGVGLRESELEALNEVAETLGMGRNAVIRYSVQMFLKMREAGLIEIQSEKVKPIRRTNKKIVRVNK